MQESARDFPGDAENVRAARRFVSETAERWNLGDLAWPLVQIVSELASNAVIHAGTDFTVRLSREGDATRIEVLDGSTRKARSRRYELDSSTGRGLQLVENLSRAWGVAGGPRGKTVWAVVDGAALLDPQLEKVAEGFLNEADDEDVAAGSAKKVRAGSRRRASRSLAA